MPPKLIAIATKAHLPVSQVWSTIAAYVRRQRDRSRDRRILMQMNDYNLRDLGLTRPHNEGPRRTN